ncbi:MAG: CRISPR-associated endonuclease Cas2 [Peptoniphilus sp.]|uniref:CRISPR-associated endonuclease Cas2 n=1 Tax=Peptoniphilus sp. TaxID=1971214 RepID=UPI002A75FE44|nr:CRISPR-associated endonuclease Cas2 [Peptoniphilus sp.]MDY2987927.1 CRISPR-associated endonuclease Cas2 [Peptoniphilus sp.]
MYMILVYDIILDEDGAKVSRNVFKTCKKYLTHIQKSVFEGELSELQYAKLQREISKYARKDRDSIIVFHSNNSKWLKKDFLGLVYDATSNFI